MYRKIARSTVGLFNNSLFNNSFWGVIAQVSQSVFLSLFFLIVARKYSTAEFADYIIVTVLYQLVAAISSLGMNQWFIREISHTVDKQDLIAKFFKLQFFFGIVFYAVNIACAYALYESSYIHFLTILFGLNLLFENLVNAIKSLNTAMFEQKKTFIILTIEAFLKLGISCVLFVYPFSITTLTILLIAIRFITLNLFLNFGSSNLISLKKLLTYRIYFKESSKLILSNWPFIIIGGVAVINWRISTIIISKVLNAIDIANYEISYKLFTIAQILPLIISTTVFPALIRSFNEGNMVKFSAIYKKIYAYYLLFGLLAYTFMYAFADIILPFAFGSAYADTGMYTKQMFLSILVFPTAFLQANMLIAMHKEKLDMWFNVVTLIINVTLCTVGLYFIKSLLVINLATFAAFLIFHIMQDIVSYRNKVVSFRHIVQFYIYSTATVACFVGCSQFISPILIFFIFWIIVGGYFIWKNKPQFLLKES